jgi:opacity protein-like surface antigen
MKIFAPAAVIVFCSIACGPPAAAQQPGWYGGLAAGVSNVDMTTRDWNDATLAKKDLNTESLAYKVMAGYRFTPYFAGELDYLHFGDVRFSANETGTAPSFWQTGKVFGRAEAKGVSVTGVLSRTFRDRYTPFARGGILVWNTTTLSNPTLSGGTLALSDQQVLHDDGISLIYAAGAELRVYRQWRMRLERGVDFPSLGVTLDF